MVQTSTDIFYSREQKREAKAQEREKRKEMRHTQMLATLQRSPMTNHKSLKDKAQGKCLICRQAGQWAKKCPNHESLLKWLATNAISWDTGRHCALTTQELQGQVPRLPSRWFNKTLAEAAAPASPPGTENHHGAGAKAATACGR